MTNKKLYEVLGDINEKYVKEANDRKRAKRSVWYKWAAMAACLCFAVFGIFAIQHLGAAPSTSIEQQLSSELVVNKADDVTQLDMDVKISHYTGISADEWEAVMEAFERTIGISYGDFTKKLPASYQQTAFYSIDAPSAPKCGEYVPHDYVFEFLAENAGKVKIAICADEAPLSDRLFICEDPKESKINGIAALIYSLQDSFMLRFSYDTVNYDIDTRSISLEGLEDLLTCITS